MTEKQYQCFVIMPFSQSSDVHTEEYWTDHFKNFLKPEIERIPNVKVYRSAELRADIVKQIIKDLYSSDIVVADLTDHNPNVFWELGVRQSLRYRTVTIAEKGTKLPFDIITKGSLFYHPEDHEKNRKFLDDLRNAIKDCIKNPDKSDSTVIDVIKSLGGGPISIDLDQRKEEIHKKMQEKKDKFKKKIIDGKVLSELGMCITVNLVEYTENLIDRSIIDEILQFIQRTCRYGPRVDNIDHFLLFNELNIERDGMWSINNNPLIGNLYIGLDGSIIFYWNFYRDEVLNKKRFPGYDITAFLLGFLDFLYCFFSHMNYLNNIDITLTMKNIKGWKFSPIRREKPTDYFYEFKNDLFEPFEKMININTIESNSEKVKLVKEIINEILLECGYTKEYRIHPDFLAQYNRQT